MITRNPIGVLRKKLVFRFSFFFTAPVGGRAVTDMEEEGGGVHLGPKGAFIRFVLGHYHGNIYVPGLM